MSEDAHSTETGDACIANDSRLLEVRDEVGSVLRLLEASEDLSAQVLESARPRASNAATGGRDQAVGSASTRAYHLSARDVLLRVLEVLEEVLVSPHDACSHATPSLSSSLEPRGGQWKASGAPEFLLAAV